MTVPIGLEAGRAEPLGATCDGRGVNFALFSAHAEKVELCIFDPTGQREVRRLPLPVRTGDVWHGYLAGARSGLIYGYRVHGPYAPERGHRFNAAKVLLDPYARRVTGSFKWLPENFGEADNAAVVPKGVVTEELVFAQTLRPETPWRDTVIYEMHVKGMTQRHPDVPVRQRGTFAGLAAPAVLDHLHRLGVTAVELLPIFAFTDETHLVRAGLTNYWGYNPISFFASEPRYGEGLWEMVEVYHAAGIEVILDVVYNHTGEGDRFGPTLSLRGIDNASYYWLDQSGEYENFAGCGNVLNMNHPQVRRLVCDSLRYWARSTGVDGFRFDLAAALGRTPSGFRAQDSLISLISDDPELGRLKLIAEPWDAEHNLLGQFPPPWREWNDRARDAARGFWRGDAGMAGRLATAICGSSDVMRAPLVGINFITCHDGFTLQDLVSFDEKKNAANGEDNRDGSNHNLSRDFGADGGAVKRAMLATLMLSQGVPMILAGDEFGQTQAGNNNAYCQDNETTWLDWSLADKNEDFLAFAARAISLRKRWPELRRETFFTGAGDVTWLRPEGGVMNDADWNDSARHAFGFLIADRLLVFLNAGDPIAFSYPPGAWHEVLSVEGRLRILERIDE